jgi:ubiquinone/menaquinone biosynthesis C-methylase UbiE
MVSLKAGLGLVPRAFPHQFAWVLNSPLRNLLIAPQTLVARIPLRSTDTILELGPGAGYFSLALADAVPEGHLELVDVQPEMLAKARARLSAHRYARAGFTVADAGVDLPFESGSFDVAVLVAVLGEVGDTARCLQSLAQVTRAGGILAVHEGWPDPDRISLPVLETLVTPHGFTLEQIDGPSWNYTAIFRRQSNS